MEPADPQSPLRVVPLRAEDQPEVPEVVALLEKSLALARAGRLRSLVLISIAPDGGYDFASTDMNRYEMVGVMETVKLKLLFERADDADEPPGPR